MNSHHLTPAPDDLFAPAADRNDVRLGTVVQRGVAFHRAEAVIVGFRCDEGVRRNGGRIGAASAPTEIRRWLYRHLANVAHQTLLPIHDAGDIACDDGNLESAQGRLGEFVAAALRAGAFPIILGGGHETAWGHLLGYVKAGLTTHVINLDAHHDVREAPVPHSGTPFRQFLESNAAAKAGAPYQVIGLQPIADHYSAYLTSKSARRWDREIVPSSRGRELSLLGNRVLSEVEGSVALTLDMDVFDQAFAPGVSAPCVNGLTPEVVLELLGRFAGSRMQSFDVCEVNPSHDRDGQTARLAARAVYTVLNAISPANSQTLVDSQQ